MTDKVMIKHLVHESLTALIIVVVIARQTMTKDDAEDAVL
jgi:hypothetical protein